MRSLHNKQKTAILGLGTKILKLKKEINNRKINRYVDAVWGLCTFEGRLRLIS
jgi:hypothetical protein